MFVILSPSGSVLTLGKVYALFFWLTFALSCFLSLSNCCASSLKDIFKIIKQRRLMELGFYSLISSILCNWQFIWLAFEATISASVAVIWPFFHLSAQFTALADTEFHEDGGRCQETWLWEGKYFFKDTVDCSISPQILPKTSLKCNFTVFITYM